MPSTTSTTISDPTQDTAATTIAAIGYDVGRVHVEVTLPSGATTMGVLNVSKNSAGVWSATVTDSSTKSMVLGDKLMLQQTGASYGTVPLAMQFSMAAANLQAKLVTANNSKTDFAVVGDVTVDADTLEHTEPA